MKYVSIKNLICILMTALIVSASSGAAQEDHPGKTTGAHPGDQFAPDYKPFFQTKPKKLEQVPKKTSTNKPKKVYVMDEKALAAHELLTEWMSLVDIHKAPSAREDELYKKWAFNSSPESIDESIEELMEKLKGELLPNGEFEFKESQWGWGGTAFKSASKLKLIGKPYLDYAVLASERVCGMINHPEKGVIFEHYGPNVRPAVFYRKPSANKTLQQMVTWGMKNPSSHETKELYYTNWLMTGHTLSGALYTIDWILDHPEVHDLEAPQIPGYTRNTGKTYKEKAVHWLMQAKLIFDTFEKYQPFDEEEGMWIVKKYKTNKNAGILDGEITEGNPAYNRAFSFTKVYIKTGVLLNKYNPEKYNDWYVHAQKRTKQAVDFFRSGWNYPEMKGSFPKENKFGKLGAWGYFRGNGVTEDRSHLGMDVGPLSTIIIDYPGAFEKDDWAVIANTLFSGEYNYTSHSAYGGLFRYLDSPVKDGLYQNGPRFSGTIAAHLPQEAYDILANEHKMIIENWLEKKFQINRMSEKWNAPSELYHARKARYGTK